MENYSREEWEIRVNLAACYHLADHFHFSDIIWNHITAKIPGTENFLINPFGLRYDEVTASNLVKIDLKGTIQGENNFGFNETGFVIHSAIHKARPDIKCVFHTHSQAGLAVSCLQDGIVPLVQDAAIFHNRVSYHSWEGVSTDRNESDRIAKDFGETNKVMILRNHGLITGGSSVEEAFILMYYLERACKTQIDVMATGMKPSIPSNSVLEYSALQSQDPRFQPGKHEWPALLRLLAKKNSIYAE